MGLFLFLSLFFWLILWSVETCHAHFPARASKTLSRRSLCLHPLDGAPGAFVSDASPVSRALLVLFINQGISVSFSLLLSYRRLCTTRFQSLKGPQHLPEQRAWEGPTAVSKGGQGPARKAGRAQRVPGGRGDDCRQGGGKGPPCKLPAQSWCTSKSRAMSQDCRQN